MIFDFFRKKKDRDEDEWRGEYAPLKEEAPEKSAVDFAARRSAAAKRASTRTVRGAGTSRRHVVELCEEIIDSSRELENARGEYQQVISQLNDITAIEGLTEQEKAPIVESVHQIQKLDQTRNEMLETEQRMSDTQFAQMQEEEDSIPNSVQRLKSNEAYLDTIKRDMNYLEGEKVEWSILRQECEHEQVVLRRSAFLLLALFSLAVLVLLVIRLYMDYDIQLLLLVVAFITALAGAYVLLKYQDCTREIRRCDVNRNQAILLENRVKLKYVNIKNAVDYTCEKYRVKNSYELTYMYEQFQAEVKEKQRFKQTSDDLTFYTERLARQLEDLHLHDASYWLSCMNALVNEKEMVTLKGGLIERRQRLRKNIEENLSAIEDLKREVSDSTRYMGEVSDQVKQILQKIDELNSPL
jgi:lipopolysaccharide export LptBFGC system permease protein LptF